MDPKVFLSYISNQGINNLFFKVIMVFVAFFYFFYALVISKQIKVMDKTLQDKYNWLFFLMSSIQVTASLILIMFAIFLI